MEAEVTLCAAMLACWPTQDKVHAIRAIKAGEVARSSLSTGGAGSRSVGGAKGEAPDSAVVETDTAVVEYCAPVVERNPGKRNVAATDRLVWKDETRALPAPLWVALHKPAGYITTAVEGAVKDEGLSVYDVLTHPNKNLRPIGRLDKVCIHH